MIVAPTYRHEQPQPSRNPNRLRTPTYEPALEGEDALFDYDDEGDLYGTADTLAFSCDYCGLDLDSPELLAAAAKIEPPGFPTTFYVEADFEPEYDYGND